jgi:hypothetical protein
MASAGELGRLLKTRSFLAFQMHQSRVTTPHRQAGRESPPGACRLQKENSPEGALTPRRAQTLAATAQSKKMWRPVSMPGQAAHTSVGEQFLEGRLARELSRSMLAR